MTDAQKLDGRRRVIIENVQPVIESLLPEQYWHVPKPWQA